MKILVTGSRGMVGRALVKNLNNIKYGKNRTRPGLCVGEVFEYDVDTDPAMLDSYCQKADFVFNLAGVNRPERTEDFRKHNFGFASILLEKLEKFGNRAPVMLSSSLQATLIGRYDGEYGRSKKEGEDLFFGYAERTGAAVYVYRFPNLMGHSRPNYNSAVSTFCWAIANDRPYSVHDRNSEVELLYIDDLVSCMLDLLEEKVTRCDYDGLDPVKRPDGRFCLAEPTHKVTLGEIVDLLTEFSSQPETLDMPLIPKGSFAKKLFSLYLSYLPKEKMRYALKMNADERGSFTEMVHTRDCGQVSVNICRPGITKGNHWHNSKWEQFIVVSGRGLIRERNLDTGETVEFEVSGEKIEAVYMIPGWTHSIENLSDTENLVTVMICNEVFDPGNPDTFYEPV